MVPVAVLSPALPGAMAAPSQPLVSLKRKHSDSAYDDDGLLSSSQLKKQKVDFDPNVEVRILEDWPVKSLDLVKEEVRRGIQRHFAGDSVGYDQLKQLFTSKPATNEAPSSGLLYRYVIALTGHASMVDKRCSGLVCAILNCQWLGRDEVFVSAYTRFIGTLISAHGGYTSNVLTMLVDKFVDLPSSAGLLPNHPIVPRVGLQTRTHNAIRYVLRLFPSASGVLSSILSSSFPHSTDSVKTHVGYVTSILKMVEYVPELKGQVLALVSERVVKIDVEIQVDLEDLEDETQENLLQEVLEDRERRVKEEEDDIFDDESDVSDEESVLSEEDMDPAQKRIELLKQGVCKMDAILDLLFSFYQPFFAEGKVVEAEEMFEHLLAQFSNAILPTYHSRHTQFLLFHFAQATPVFTERFVGTCSQVALDKNRPHLIRSAAAAYLASFVARGAHVSTQLVRSVFGLLANNLNVSLHSYEPHSSGPDIRRYGAYYAVAQALLYIFCFRWRDLIDNDEDAPIDDDDLFDSGDIRWVPGLKETLTRNIDSRLNPLKVCSPAIVMQFARIANHLKFMYIFSKVEINKRLRLTRAAAVVGAGYGSVPERETALSAKMGESAFQLDAYFPFDPYQLPKSKKWIEGDYVAWKPIPGLDDEDDGDGSDSENELAEEDEEVDEDTETDEDVM